MYVQEVVVVLHQDPPERKGGVVVLVGVDLDPLLLLQQPVGPLLIAKEPDVDVATLTVRRRGVEQTQSIPLEEHHAYPVASVEGSQIANQTLLPRPSLLDLLHIDPPLQPQYPIGKSRLEKLPLGAFPCGLRAFGSALLGVFVRGLRAFGRGSLGVFVSGLRAFGSALLGALLPNLRVLGKERLQTIPHQRKNPLPCRQSINLRPIRRGNSYGVTLII